MQIEKSSCSIEEALASAAIIYSYVKKCKRDAGFILFIGDDKFQYDEMIDNMITKEDEVHQIGDNHIIVVNYRN